MRSIKKSYNRIITSVLAVILLSSCTSEPASWNLANITGYRPQLNFEMVNADTGKTTTAEAFRERLMVLNFGFTHCPDVCPISLHQINAALSKMGDLAQDVVVLFVTVDPERDTLAVLKSYTDSFGDQVIGLRGTSKEIEALTKRYRVSVRFETPDEQGQYEVFHGSGMTVFDQKGKARLLIRPSDDADSIASDLTRLLNETSDNG